MAGRRPMPLEVHLANGNRSHLTKAEIEQRRNAKVNLGTTKMVKPAQVKANQIASKKWDEVMKIYKGSEVASSSDVGMISRYCLTWAEYIDLVERRAYRAKTRMENGDEAEMTDILSGIYQNEKRAEKLVEYVMLAYSTKGILELDKAINAKLTVLAQMEDRMFLNPLAKIKNIPKQEKEETNAVEKEFGNI